jgi:hypothetical protein
MKEICIKCLKENPNINCLICEQPIHIVYNDFCNKPSLNIKCKGKLCQGCPKKIIINKW